MTELNIEDLKCCGNCNHYWREKELCYQSSVEIIAPNVCNFWQYDGKKSDDRSIEWRFR